YELLKLASQFEAYHEHYPNHPAANALTPSLRGRNVREPGPTSQSKKTGPDRQLPRKRPHIMTVESGDERNRIIGYALRIAELVQLQDANGGKLPPGELDTAAAEYEKSPDWIEKQMKIRYCLSSRNLKC